MAVDGASGVKQVRRTRNAAQHAARQPTPAEVHEARAYDHLFLVSLYGVVWGRDFDLDEVEELANEEVRDHFVYAARAHDEGDYAAAVG